MAKSRSSPPAVDAKNAGHDSLALSNAEIAERLSSLAQLLGSKGENPFKIRAYRRAAETIRNLTENIDELVRGEADLTQFTGIGKGISGAIREIVLSGKLRQLEALRTEVSPELAALSEFPKLDPKRVLRVYKQLEISTVEELKRALESGALREKCGVRMEQHVRQALTESHEILLCDADEIAERLTEFLLRECKVDQVEPAGAFRRRAEVVGEIAFLVRTSDFGDVVAKFRRYGGRAEVLENVEDHAMLRLSSGIKVRLDAAEKKTWGLAWVRTTGSEAHLEKLGARKINLTKRAKSKDAPITEEAVYRALGLDFVPPELREGGAEVELASAGKLPLLVSPKDLRGDLHAHSTSSDGAHSIERMAEAARERGYAYLGITDHSQSLKIAGGVSEEGLWKQIRAIDKLNGRSSGFQVLKSAEVDILEDGALDYPNSLLKELDYTVCSIHSRFGLGKEKQTERILRAMDNPYFNILGHATGRLLLRRPGYELDIPRLVAHAKAAGCFFEINSSPDRLDLSAENARLARDAGVKIAICTDAHSTAELDFIRWGIDQARRAGLDTDAVLNCMPWSELRRVLRRR